jgi:hypothetical protein
MKEPLPESENCISPNFKPELRLTPSYQLGFLQGSVRAFLRGYSTRELLESSFHLVLAWQKEQDEMENAALKGLHDGLQIDSVSDRAE